MPYTLVVSSTTLLSSEIRRHNGVHCSSTVRVLTADAYLALGTLGWQVPSVGLFLASLKVALTSRKTTVHTNQYPTDSSSLYYFPAVTTSFLSSLLLSISTTVVHSTYDLLSSAIFSTSGGHRCVPFFPPVQTCLHFYSAYSISIGFSIPTLLVDFYRFSRTRALALSATQF